jgi:integrase
VTVAINKRRSFALPEGIQCDAAEKRAMTLAEFAMRLRGVGREDIVVELLNIATERDGKEMAEVRKAVDLIVAGQVIPKRNGNMMSIGELGARWTSGELSRMYPDHIRRKRSAEEDRNRLERYVFPVVGDVPMDQFTLDDAEQVMRGVPIERAAATRRHVAQILYRMCRIAVFPLRLLKTSPLPVGFLPKVGPGKAKGWVYPDEDAKLLASDAVPFEWRLYYGFLHREGMRSAEAARMEWTDLDLQRGGVALDKNKTNDPRAWALSLGIPEALRAWRAIREGRGERIDGNTLVFVDEEGNPMDEGKAAKRYRAHLRSAGITRDALFERSETRQPVRLHDTRATFITVALANGKSEAWVQDRTGHRSSIMINRYRRAARTVGELGLGDFRRLDEALGIK